MHDGTQVQIGDKEEAELALMKKYGGKAFRLILKRGSERVTEGKVYSDAPVRPVVITDLGPQAGTSGSIAVSEASATADVAKCCKSCDQHDFIAGKAGLRCGQQMN